EIPTELTNLDGLTMDNEGYIYVSAWGTNSVYRYDNDISSPPTLISSGHNGPADIFFNRRDRILAVPNLNIPVVEFINCTPPGNFLIEDISLADDNDNQILEPGETVEIVISLSNLFYAPGVSAELNTTDADITVESAEAYYGHLEIGSIADNSDNPFVISLSEDLAAHNAVFSLTLTTEDGSED
ncbi:MAG: SMP-30/gluconolactonase/LRE family protein, partial [candidate division Zixibacteria bacterium]|nr:SMP-30/gluconolactonase/LRE family protein [candidate division Zixibacteria bacterium]